jgi:molybdenum cofactor cytidylyltransferase
MSVTLKRALDIKPGDSIAFVGAGGKTSAIFALAKELSSPVIITTTTHLGVWQAELADAHKTIQYAEDVHALDDGESQTILLTGPAGDDERFSSLDEGSLEAVRDFCLSNQFMFLIEADGARQRFLKAPAEYEPVIPPWVDQVVVLAGLKGLDQAITDEFIHRPKRFAELSGLNLGDKVDVESLAAVMGAKMGGLQGIPDGCQTTLFLNQAEGDTLKAKGGHLARNLMNIFDRVLVGSVQEPDEGGPIFSVHAKTAGVILAAGGSQRLGIPKQLLPWEGEPYIIRVIKSAIAAGLSPVVVVTGADHEVIEDALQGYPVTICYNPDWEEGQSTSMKIGVNAVPENCDGCVFLLSDQPQISPILVRQLLERRALTLSSVIAPMVDERRGNPVFFGRETFESLMSISGDQGGRAIFNQYQISWVTWIDRRMQIDVDHLSDEDSLQKAYYP